MGNVSTVPDRSTGHSPATERLVQAPLTVGTLHACIASSERLQGSMPDATRDGPYVYHSATLQRLRHLTDAESEDDQSFNLDFLQFVFLETSNPLPDLAI